MPLQVADAVKDPTTYFTWMNVPVERVRRLEITAGNYYKLLHDADLHLILFFFFNQFKCPSKLLLWILSLINLL